MVFNGWLSDVRHGLRLAVRQPGTSLLAVLSLGLGIGVSATFFSILDGLVFRPFPVSRPSELVAVASRGPDNRLGPHTYSEYEDVRRSATSFASLAAITRRSAILRVSEDSEMLLLHAVTPNFFDVLGVPPAVGSTDLSDRQGAPAVVLGDRLWRRKFQGDPSIVGRTVLLDNKAFVVAGVTRPGFLGIQRNVVAGAWVGTPAWFDVLGHREERSERTGGQFELVGRLKAGVSDLAAAHEVDAILRRPGGRPPIQGSEPGSAVTRDFTADRREWLLTGGLLLAVVGLVLFAACANVAQLRLAEMEARRRELGVRLAIGGDATRIVRQLLCETAMLAVAGSAAGVLIARWLIRLIPSVMTIPNYMDYGIRLDYRVIWFTAALALAAIALAGLPAARQSLRLDLTDVLRSDQAGIGLRTSRVRGFLVIGQIAASVVLLTAALLLVQSLFHGSAIRPSMDPDRNLLIVSPTPGPTVRGETQTLAWLDIISQRVASLRGVKGVTYARRVPLSGSGGGATVSVAVPGAPPGPALHFNNIAAGYFDVTGARLLRGRSVGPNDNAGAAKVVLVTEAFVRQYFPEREPLGQWMTVAGAPRQIVGVVEDGPSNDLREPPEPFLYLPFSQMPVWGFTLLVHTDGDPASLAAAIKSAIHEVDPQALFGSATTLRTHLRFALNTERTTAFAATGLAGLGLVLTCAGLLGVVLHRVSQRTRELGLRVALGARSGDIQRLVIKAALRLAVWGVPIGIVLAVFAGDLMRSLLFGVSPFSPVILTASAVVVTVLTLVAAWWPAWRASRIDPMSALRSE